MTMTTMTLALGRLLFFLTAQAAPPVSGGQPVGTAPPAGLSEAPESPDAVAPPELAPYGAIPPPPPPLFRGPPRYGDQGTPEIALGAGYSSATGFLAAAGFRYFVLDGLAPGIEGTYVSGGPGGAAYGLALASLRFVPLRTPSFALALTGRAGRVFLADHGDGWGVGGEVAVIVTIGAGVGLELGYEYLQLEPGHFCADLGGCVLQGPVVGLRLVL
jgi:hypothetical protein